MNLHMNRRLEVLAREIAAAKAPKLDATANALFAQIGKRPECKTVSDGGAQTTQLPPSSPAQDSGWIEHRAGDPCPVDGETFVHCKNRHGTASQVRPMRAAAWNWTGDGYGVTAYRVVKP